MSFVEKINGFVQSVWVESKKVSWPNREELQESTGVVLVAASIVMLYLFVVDRILTLLLNPVLG
jgi:preprotein translocase SecE subunit